VACKTDAAGLTRCTCWMRGVWLQCGPLSGYQLIKSNYVILQCAQKLSLELSLI